MKANLQIASTSILLQASPTLQVTVFSAEEFNAWELFSKTATEQLSCFVELEEANKQVITKQAS